MHDLFHFSFQNGLGFLIAFVPALINLGLICYIVFFLPRNKITNVFALLTLCLFFWQITDSLERISIHAAAADAWDIIFCFSWSFVGPLSLHFSLLYSKRTRLCNSRPFMVLMYLPGFLFMALYRDHFYPHHFKYFPFWGWINGHNENIIDRLFIYWVALMVLAATTILLLYSRGIRHNRSLRKQSFLIGIGITVPTLIGLVSQVLVPLILGGHAIPLTSTAMTFFSLATVVALTRYNLFSPADLVNYETLLENLPVMVFSISREWRLNYMNQFCYNLIGIGRKESRRVHLSMLARHHSPEDRKAFRLAWELGMGGRAMDMVEWSMDTPKGTFCFLLSTSPITNNHQVAGVLFVGRDITALKRTQSLVKYKESLLEEAQRISHVGSWEWDMRTDSGTWSDELYRIHGYEPGEFRLNFEKFLEMQHPADKARVEAAVRQAIKDGKPFSYHSRIIRKGGEEALVFSKGSVSLDQNGVPYRMWGTRQDVTEWSKKEQLLEEQNRELQKINQELDRFVYSVSHDLRAPLTSIMGLVAISRENVEDPDQAQRLDLVQGSIERLDHFIQDILNYSRNSRLEIAPERIDFKKLLEEIIESIQFANSAAKKVRVTTEIEGQTPFATSKSRLTIALNNLICNAIRYSNPEARNPYARIRILVSTEGADIQVQDNGIGIPEGLQGKVFEMFYRGSERSTGSGLGLYIVRETVQKLKGEISLESRPGQGSCFRMRIPNLMGVVA